MRLSTRKATTGMIGMIHALKAKAGMDDDTYRDFLDREARVRTAKELTVIEAGRVIERLKEAAGQGAGVRGAVAGLDKPVGRKLRALWIAGYDLAIVRDRTDRAMLSFLERQTGRSHVNFLGEPRAGNAAIEGLKSWLAREGKVAWPSDTADVIAAKRAVLEAQWLILVALGAVKPFIEKNPLGELDDYAFRVIRRNGWCFFEERDYDEVQKALGRKIRAWIANYGDTR